MGLDNAVYFLTYHNGTVSILFYDVAMGRFDW